LAVVLVLAAGTTAGWRWWVGPIAEVLAVQRRDAVQTVVASGHVESPNRVDIGAALTGTVQQVPVVEGQAVKAGDVLLRLDSAELRATAQAAQLALQQAQGRLRQLQEVQRPVAEQALRQAEATRDNALAQLRRQQDLARQGFIGEAALEDARKTAALAQAQARSAQTQWASLRSDGADFALAQAAVAQARAAADAALAKADTSTVRAPVAGTLIGRNVEVGDVVQPGKVLMTLSPAGALQLVVDIDEKNLQLLALGQRALASADAFAQQRFEAVLAYINPGVNAATGAVQVKLDVPQPPPGLRQDMTVSVDIAVAHRAQALLLPATAVHDADSAQPWVLQVEAGRARRVALHTGLRSGGWVQVVDGLHEGDLVLPATSALTDGARLRASAVSAASAAPATPAASAAR